MDVERATRACELLVEAYGRGLECGGSTDWDDLNLAYEVAKQAIAGSDYIDPRIDLNATVNALLDAFRDGNKVAAWEHLEALLEWTTKPDAPLPRDPRLPLITALAALLDWGREHTSPRDPNSPHALLVNAHHALGRLTEGGV